MSTHRSNVNFRKLIQNLADMYPYDPAEVVFIELIANALDSHATRMEINWDIPKRIFTLVDNGEGMSESQFAEYHDFAAELKTRGGGIGFAGVGAKISFNIADRVVTETRSATFAGGSNWFLDSKGVLIWEDLREVGLESNGTKVSVHFDADLPDQYFSTAEVEHLLKRHYLPLLVSRFREFYDSAKIYDKNIQFIANGKLMQPSEVVKMFDLDKKRVLVPKKRKNVVAGFGILGLAEEEYPLGYDRCGVLLCTYGKVVKAELFNQFPGQYGPKIFGVVEIPELIKHLTTSKTDFVRKRSQSRELDRILDDIRGEFKDWLGQIGVQSPEISDEKEARQIEKELKKIIDEIPELSEFLGYRVKRPIYAAQPNGGERVENREGGDATYPAGNGKTAGGNGPVGPGDDDVGPLEKDPKGRKTATPITRTARGGPRILIEEWPAKVDLAWVEGDKVVINSGHPSYIRTPKGSRERRLHNLFAVAVAIQKAIPGEDNKPDLMFIDRMMKAWGSK
jgi:hypothetical protein